MEDVKQMIITRYFYDDYELFKQRMPLFKDTLIPSLKRQTNKNFIFAIIADNFIEELRSEVDYPFMIFATIKDAKDYCIKERIELQTRQDSDDTLGDDYVEICQQQWAKYRGKGLRVIINFQLTIVYYETGKVRPFKHPNDNVVYGMLTVGSDTGEFGAYDRHMRAMPAEADVIVQIPPGHVTYHLHDHNVLKLKSNDIKLRI